jgi:hypothetical protein
MSGVARSVTVLPIRVFARCTFENGLATKDLINALSYAAANGASVISVSYNHDHTPAAEEAYDKCGSFDILIAIAAGNSGCDMDGSSTCGSFPARYAKPHMVTVCATMPNDTLGTGGAAGASNYG